MYGRHMHQYSGQQGQHGGYGNDGHVQFSFRPIVLDDYNSDLNFVVEADGLTGSCLHQDGFEYLWAGARATHGVSSGKACFEVVVGEKLAVKMPETERTPHVVRIGWSTDFSSFQVGEDVMSYGYGGTGKASVNKKFSDYGQPYSIKDVIGCYINLDARSIFFTKNGHYLGEAFRLGPEANDTVFYPHVTVKNMKVHINFGLQKSYFPPVDGYTMIQHIPPNVLVRALGSPDTRKDCQVIMMVGIPGCGKTCWAEKYAKEHKNRKFNIIGTNTIMEKMKVVGLARKRNYHGRWDALIKQATDILNKILKIAENKNRNYILDQTNVYPGARKRKIRNFHGFHRIAAVLVTKDEELKYRTEKREKEEGKIVPESAVMQMKANFTLPERNDTFDEVWFVEEDEETSRRLVEKYNREGINYKEQEHSVKDPPGSQPHSGNSKWEHPQYYPSANLHPPNREEVCRHGTHNPGLFHGYGSHGYGSTDNPGAPFKSQDVRHQARFPASQGEYPSSHLHHSPNLQVSHGYSAHNPRVFYAYDTHGYGSNNPDTPIVSPNVGYQTKMCMSQGNSFRGAVGNNPEREAYNMSGSRGMPPTMQNRYTPYDPAHRYDTYSEHVHNQSHVSSRRYENRSAWPYTRNYESSYSEHNNYSVPDSRPPGRNTYESLTPSVCNSIREPVENEYHDAHNYRRDR